MTQEARPFRFPFIQFVLLLTALAITCTVLYYRAPSPALSTDSTPASTPLLTFSRVVLDAGHGGEDGGTQSATEVLEKDLNLHMAMLLADLFAMQGTEVILTREDDRLLYDPTSDYQGHKKEQDLAARLKIATSVQDALFISIHMNAFPQTQYRGLQVWYSPNHESSLPLAQAMQATVRTYLQPQNARRVKPATSSIFLLHHLNTPALLVECGFLSNPEEANLLATPEYRQQLALLIFLSTFSCEGAYAK